MEKGRKNNKGITLIALVITIIVLLILAGITIASITGEKGIIKEARTAKELSEKAALEEQVELAIIKAEEKHKNPTIDDVIEELKNNKVISKNDQVDKETGSIITDIGYEIVGKLDDYIGKESTGDNDPSGGGEEEPSKPAEIVEELKEGDYINYIDKNNIKRTSIVLYDKQSGYGVQVITVDSVGEITLGSATDITKCRNDYNNIVTTLNNKANSYLNTNYASGARSPGTLPDNPSLDTTKMVGSGGYSYMYNYENLFKQGDDNDKIDKAKIRELGLTDGDVGQSWAASRFGGADDSQSLFGVNTTYGGSTLVTIFKSTGPSLREVKHRF